MELKGSNFEFHNFWTLKPIYNLNNDWKFELNFLSVLMQDPYMKLQFEVLCIK